MSDIPDEPTGPHLPGSKPSDEPAGPGDAPASPADDGPEPTVESAAAAVTHVEDEAAPEASADAEEGGRSVRTPVVVAIALGVVAIVVLVAFLVTQNDDDDETAETTSTTSTTVPETTVPETTAPPSTEPPATAPPNQWPELAVATFTENCKSRGLSDTQCQCLLDESQALFTWEEYSQLFANLDPNAPTPPELQPMVDKCLLGQG